MTNRVLYNNTIDTLPRGSGCLLYGNERATPIEDTIKRAVAAIDAARMKWMAEKHPDGKYYDEDFSEVPDEVLVIAVIQALTLSRP